MKKQLFFALFFGSLAFLSTAQTLDQSNVINGAPNISPSQGDTLAQSFKAGISGYLSNVEFKVTTWDCPNIPNTPITVLIYAGDGPNQLLSTEYFALPIDMEDSLYNFVFSNPVAIPAGNHYTIGFHVEGSPDCNGNGGTTYLFFTYNNGNSYPDGKLYDMHSNVSELQNYDVYFNTYVTCATIDTFAHPTCGGYLDGFVDVDVAGSANYTYAWSNGANTQDLSNVAAGTYTLTLTSNDGCVMVDSVTLEDPYTDIVTSLENKTDNNCFGDESGSIEISVVGGEPGPGYSYAWDQDAGSTNNATNLSGGTYTVVVTDSVGCTDTITYTIDEPEALDVTTTLVSTTIVANLSNASYQWIDCDNGNALIPNEENVIYTAQVNGNYAVIVSDNGCTDTSECVAINSVGLEEAAFDSPISFYPNPTNGTIHLDFGSLQNAVDVTVLDLEGRVVLKEVHQPEGDVQIQLNVPAGVYFMNVESNGQKAVFRIAKN